ncbi:SDR family NAD(P)-dependent oxidoreductase [Streptomyces lavendulae]|uniref:SDR family NAD(P)-dependent oxidoreductase n=1 Tax=Streptomyces lavendulae TaxID=1914 RepID=UPI0036C44340
MNIGSMGGFVTAPAAGLYSESKFALEGVSEALYGEPAPLGVRVTIVEPGGFRTDFLSSLRMQVEPASIADYADITEVAEPPLRLQLGADAIERVEAKLDLVRSALDRWRPRSPLHRTVRSHPAFERGCLIRRRGTGRIRYGPVGGVNSAWMVSVARSRSQVWARSLS